MPLSLTHAELLDRATKAKNSRKAQRAVAVLLLALMVAAAFGVVPDQFPIRGY